MSAGKCPKCSKDLVLKTATRGFNKGGQFWGCSDYPSCRGTRPYSNGTNSKFGSLTLTVSSGVKFLISIGLVSAIGWLFSDYRDSLNGYQILLIAIAGSEKTVTLDDNYRDYLAWEIAKVVRKHQESAHKDLWDQKYRKITPDISIPFWPLQWNQIKRTQIALEKVNNADFEKQLELAAIANFAKKENQSFAISKSFESQPLVGLATISSPPLPQSESSNYFVFTKMPKIKTDKQAYKLKDAIASALPSSEKNVYLFPAPQDFSESDLNFLNTVAPAEFKGAVELTGKH
jgi:ssDNA-binding Zn-finger/Zn-ribbon topoisomerase 1